MLSIALGVFQARHSHADVKECYGSKVNKDEFVNVTIGLAEPTRGGRHDQVPLDESKERKD
jgi:hypothetical protein